MSETEQKLLAAEAETIMHSVDGLLQQAFNIYDIGKALPHPYDAIGSYGSHFLHDYRNFAFRLKRFTDRVVADGSDVSA